MFENSHVRNRQNNEKKGLEVYFVNKVETHCSDVWARNFAHLLEALEIHSICNLNLTDDISRLVLK